MYSNVLVLSVLVLYMYMLLCDGKYFRIQELDGELQSYKEASETLKEVIRHYTHVRMCSYIARFFRDSGRVL